MTKKYARAIKTEQDFKGAAQATKKILAKADRDSAEERRLQALIKVMEEYDDEVAEAESDDGTDDWPRRRWSDDASES